MVVSPVVPAAAIGNPVGLMIPVVAGLPTFTAPALAWPSVVAGSPIAARPLFPTAALTGTYAGSLLTAATLPRTTRAITAAWPLLATSSLSGPTWAITAARP
jgi:hypothetical protein